MSAAWYAENRERIAEHRKQPEVRAHLNANQRAYHARNKDRLNARRRERHLLTRYGLTAAAFDAILERQGGGCAICRTTEVPRGWHVDHDHVCCAGPRSCGKCVRGILCASCNGALGLFGDSVDTLNRAVRYLQGATR